MKIYKYIATACVLAFMTSCGVSDRNEEIKNLREDNEEWTADQTDQAIDILLEGRSEASDLSKDVFLAIQKQDLEGQINIKGKKSVIKERKDEIKEAEKNLKEVEKAYRKKKKELYDE